MIVVVSGEGSTDIGIGSSDVENAIGDDFQPGPMAWVIDHCLDLRLNETYHYNFSAIESDAMVFVSRNQIERVAKALPTLRKPKRSFPGVSRPQGTGLFYRSARALGRIAAEVARRNPDTEVIAVLFHDCDGTRSTRNGLWEEKFRSVLDGFLAEGFFKGVPMIPRPKSEAWLICAVKTDPYRNCDDLEDRSGNDNSPNNLKAELAALPEFQLSPVSSSRLVEPIRNGVIDPSKIEMPSFIAFRDRLHDTL